VRLFHFSEAPDIEIFIPRPVRVPVERPQGSAWLNGPLVWAIDEWHEPMYLFPRECPRILVWPTAETTDEDIAQWFDDEPKRMIAHVETEWLSRLRTATIYRYELPVAAFENLNDVGMWVSRRPVAPLAVDELTNLIEELNSRNVELRTVDSLLSLKDVWKTSLHASGVRLRNVEGWGEPGWPHSKQKGKRRSSPG
jgi:hypothetical protein